MPDNIKPSVLVAGADGTIGSSLASHLENIGCTVIRTSRNVQKASSLFLDFENVDAFLDTAPSFVDTVVIAAGMTKFETCRLHPEKAKMINVLAPVALATHYINKGVRVLFFSTSAVFDGSRPLRRSTEMPDGRSLYGILKAQAEKQLLALPGSLAVLRLTKVVRPDAFLFSEWKKKLLAGRKIHCFRDQYISPVSLEEVLQVSTEIIKRNTKGIYQLSASYDVSYFDIGVRIASAFGVDTKLVLPTTAAENNLHPTEIFHYNSLDTESIQKELGYVVPNPFDFITNLYSGIV